VDVMSAVEVSAAESSLTAESIPSPVDILRAVRNLEKLERNACWEK